MAESAARFELPVKEIVMRHRISPDRLGVRLYHPLLALLIAAIAAVGAISQSGLLLDAATAGQGAAEAPLPAGSAVGARSAERHRVVAAQAAATSDAGTRQAN